LTKDRITGPKINANMPCTVNPGTNNEASQKQTPFTISENAPKLRKLSGRDKVDKIGFTEEFTKPIATAAMIAAGNVAMSIPGTARSTTSRLRAVASQVKKIPIIVFPQLYRYKNNVNGKIASRLTTIFRESVTLYLSTQIDFESVKR
jgi:hypothetical protein